MSPAEALVFFWRFSFSSWAFLERSDLVDIPVSCRKRLDWEPPRSRLTFALASRSALMRALTSLFSSLSLFLPSFVSFLDFFVFSGWLIGLRSFAFGYPLRPAAWRSALDERQMLRCRALVEEPLVFYVV